MQLAGDALSAALIGIELEELPPDPVTFAQIDSLAELMAQLAGEWGWSWPFVIHGHYGVAVPVGRRSDPYAFDWGAFFGRLYVYSKQVGLLP